MIVGLVRDIKDLIDDCMDDLFDDYEVLESTTDRSEQILLIDRMVEKIERVEEAHRKLQNIVELCLCTTDKATKSMTDNLSSVLVACGNLKTTLLNKKGVI